ncbi:DUF3311 domain-containing protein [Edaphobacter aggregans]|uniref:DUF3311 domain-containing protein n=1 Tax=Edaphobacter aggregans TaxID=570835 RepID=UPI00068B0247|nr:DUF3311 domain-containing protein [Edaphobacter aggregans]
MTTEPNSQKPSKQANTASQANKKSPAIWTLLAVPYLALCFPQIYARATPTLLGFPFFYWYQFLWVILTSIILGVAYLRLKEPTD